MITLGGLWIIFELPTGKVGTFRLDIYYSFTVIVRRALWTIKANVRRSSPRGNTKSGLTRLFFYLSVCSGSRRIMWLSNALSYFRLGRVATLKRNTFSIRKWVILKEMGFDESNLLLFIGLFVIIFEIFTFAEVVQRRE